jgi:hypothetical protein
VLDHPGPQFLKYLPACARASDQVEYLARTWGLGSGAFAFTMFFLFLFFLENLFQDVFENEQTGYATDPAPV